MKVKIPQGLVRVITLSTILANCATALNIRALPQTPPQPPPPPIPDRTIDFTGPTKLDGFDWLVDDATSGFTSLTYVYKCGTASTHGAFNPWACYWLRAITGCSDNNGNPFVNGEAETCAADGSTGVTAFVSREEKDVHLSTVQLWRDTCGWLGGRCGENFVGAMAFIMEEEEGRTKVNIDVDGYGAIKLYNT